jgi:putative transposase
LALGISKYSYYYSKDPKSTLTTKYQHLRTKIEAVIRSNPAYGYPRIKQALKDRYGIIVNHKLLLKLLNLWGLQLKRKIRYPKKTFVQKVLDFLQSRANLLRKVVITGLFQAIVSDLTRIEFKNGVAWLCVHMDIYGKMVYGWNLSQSPNTDCILESFRKTRQKLAHCGIKDLSKIIFHSDRGSVYTSSGYVSELLEAGVYISYSKKGEPGDNAVNEAFFSRLKEEWRDIFAEAETEGQLAKLVKKSINYYNNKRYHTSIGTQTPKQFLKSQIKNLKQKNPS